MIFLATFKSIVWCVQVKGRRLRIILIHRGLQINQVEHTCLFWRYGHWFLFILFHRLILQNERDKMQGIRMNMVLLNRLLTCILRSFDLLRFYFTIFQTISVLHDSGNVPTTIPSYWTLKYILFRSLSCQISRVFCFACTVLYIPARLAV